MSDFLKRVAKVQQELKAPKNQYNSFGKYKYRSCEDILEAAKPLCIANGIVMQITDDIVFIGERYYVKATVILRDTETDEVMSNSALARESFDKKGMDDSQITGTASSYARKYALNGMFCIDDTKDADTDEYHNANSSTTNTKRQKYICTSCGNEVKPYKKSDGTIIPADKVYSSCNGMCLACFNAQKKGEQE